MKALRARQRRNLLTTLLLSQGVPMLLHGDELGRTQLGNNNVYAQDSPISWIDWRHVDETFLAFANGIVEFRRTHPVFRRRRWFEGRSGRGDDSADIGWYTPQGTPMSESDWNTGFARSLSVYLNGELPSRDQHGQAVVDTSFLVLFNAHFEPLVFTVPPVAGTQRWAVVLDTAAAQPPSLVVTDDAPRFGLGDEIEVIDRAVMVLQQIT